MSAAVATRPAGVRRLTANQLPAWTSGLVLAVSLAASATLFALTGSFGLVRTLAVALVIYGIITLVRGGVLMGILLIVLGLLVGPGGVSIFTT